MEREWKAARLDASAIAYIDEGALGYAKSLPDTVGVSRCFGLDTRAGNVRFANGSHGFISLL